MPVGVHNGPRGRARLPEGARQRLINLTDREKLIVDAVVRAERGRRLSAGDGLLLHELWHRLGVDTIPQVLRAIGRE